MIRNLMKLVRNITNFVFDLSVNKFGLNKWLKVIKQFVRKNVICIFALNGIITILMNSKKLYGFVDIFEKNCVNNTKIIKY